MTLLVLPVHIFTVLAWFSVLLYIVYPTCIYLVEFCDKKFALAWHINSKISEYLWLTYLYVVMNIYIVIVLMTLGLVVNYLIDVHLLFILF